MKILTPLLLILLALLMAFSVEKGQNQTCSFRFKLRKEWIKKEIQEAARVLHRFKTIVESER